MSIYIAMLRGVNVGGIILKMERLRESFLAMGFQNIRSYVQSGNVLFEAGRESATRLSETIEQQITQDFGLAISVLMRTPKAMQAIIQHNPFLPDPAIDQSKLHVTFLSVDPPQNALDLLQPLATKPEQVHVLGREVYLYCPHGYGQTKLSNSAIERKLSVRATTRNWKTTNTLLAMAQ
jgi:uncharacterized protein (DUF1697 family)